MLEPYASAASSLLGARAALGANADLEDLVDMAHLRGAADRTRQPLAHAAHVLAPVDVSVDLHQA